MYTYVKVNLDFGIHIRLPKGAASKGAIRTCNFCFPQRETATYGYTGNGKPNQLKNTLASGHQFAQIIIVQTRCPEASVFFNWLAAIVGNCDLCRMIASVVRVLLRVIRVLVMRVLGNLNFCLRR